MTPSTMAARDYVLFNVRPQGARLGSDGGVHAGLVLAYHYRHASADLLAPAVQDLAPHNGPATPGFGHLVVLLAAALRPLPEGALAALCDRWLGEPVANIEHVVADALRQCQTPASRAYLDRLAGANRLPDAQLKGLPVDVRARGPRTPRAVAVLWSDFFATGDREVVRAILTALPDWHVKAAPFRAQHKGPDDAAKETAGYAVAWSLVALGRQHARLRALLAEARDDAAVALPARDEVVRILADIEAAGADPIEPAVESFLAARGVALVPAAPPPVDVTPPTVEGSLPSLSPLDDIPSTSWLEALGSALPDPPTNAQALAAAAASAPPEERGARARAAGLACAGTGCFALAAELLATPGALDGDARVVFERARFAGECADRASLWSRATDFLDRAVQAHAELNPGVPPPGSAAERERDDLCLWRVDVARRAQRKDRLPAALDAVIELCEVRLATLPTRDDQHSLGRALMERALLDPGGAELGLVRAIATLERALAAGAPAAGDLGMALLHRALGWARAGRQGSAVGLFDQAVEKLDAAAASGDPRALGSSLEARVQRAVALHRAGERDLAKTAATDALERIRALTAEPEGAPYQELARWAERALLPIATGAGEAS